MVGVDDVGLDRDVLRTETGTAQAGQHQACCNPAFP